MAKGKVYFDQDRCKGCELCTTACPVKIVVMDKTQINKKEYQPATKLEMDKCIGCANCKTMCPHYIITVKREQ